jgi:hypothetical protein
MVMCVLFAYDGFVLINIAMTFYVILGLFILGSRALYVLKVRILRGEIFCGAAKGDYFRFLCSYFKKVFPVALEGR